MVDTLIYLFLRLHFIRVCFSFLFVLLFCYEDIDECSNGTHDCHENANCTNIPGSFNCSCKKGHFRNGSLCSGTKKKIFNIYPGASNLAKLV